MTESKVFGTGRSPDNPLGLRSVQSCSRRVKRTASQGGLHKAPPVKVGEVSMGGGGDAGSHE